MVAADGSQRLGETIAHIHTDTDGVYKFLDLRRDSSACRGEEMGVLQTQLLAYKREDGFVQQLIFQMQTHGRAFAT